MRSVKFIVVFTAFVALMFLAGTQSAWAGPMAQTVPTFTPTPEPVAQETPNPDSVVDAPSGEVLNFGTFEAGAIGCADCTVTITEVRDITTVPYSGYTLLQTPVSVVASSENAMVVACFPISLAKYPNAQIWLYDPVSTMWTVAPVYQSDDGMLCGYAFGSGIFAPFTP